MKQNQPQGQRHLAGVPAPRGRSQIKESRSHTGGNLHAVLVETPREGRWWYKRTRGPSTASLRKTSCEMDQVRRLKAPFIFCGLDRGAEALCHPNAGPKSAPTWLPNYNRCDSCTL